MQKFSSKKKLIHSFKLQKVFQQALKFFLTVIETTYLLYIKWKEFTLFPLTAQKYIELQTFKVIRKMKIAFLKRKKNKDAKVTHFKLSHLSDIKSFVQLKWYYKMINLKRCTLIIHKLITAIIL